MKIKYIALLLITVGILSGYKSLNSIHWSNHTNLIEEKILIDKVHYFPSTNEAYMWIGFKEGYDWKALDTLKKYADSVIYDDGETKRTNYPMNEAKKYLDLELLDGVYIFNEFHQKLGSSKIKRVEFFEDLLGDQFIVILQPQSRLVGNSYYGINGYSNFIKGLVSKEVKNDEMDFIVKKYIDKNSHIDWCLEHVKVDLYNSIYSYYSFAGDIGEKSFLLETNQTTKNISTLAEITNDFSIWDLTPVSIEINEKPVLLLWLGVPETDIEWYSPAIYDGSKYQIKNTRKIELKKFITN